MYTGVGSQTFVFKRPCSLLGPKVSSSEEDFLQYNKIAEKKRKSEKEMRAI